MADERSASRGTAGQAHAIGPASPGPAAGQRQDSPPRGPRTLLLRRSENGFGFTLRHFIVYPPESCCVLPGHERTRIDEPMDTIFVKQVRENSPAAEAGLRTGDRVVSVDGAPTRGQRYASVVQRIQQAGPWLRLLVVSKEDDILQRYFGETAHNPETNQRLARHRSPDRLSQKHRRSMSMIPGPSARARQSWICQSSGGASSSAENRRSSDDDCGQSARSLLSSVKTPPSTTASSAGGGLETSPRRQPLAEAAVNQENRRSLPRQATTAAENETRCDLYGGARPESIYSRPSSERIYDRIKDPIYERVRPGLAAFSKSLDQQRYPMSRAEPQVPIYRPGRRVVARRASEGSGRASDASLAGYGSNEALGGTLAVEPGSRLSVESARDSSPASKDSLSSYDSNSTLTGNECSDDSIIMSRLRKSFEQKEEFLRRPSQPIGWLVPEDAAAAAAAAAAATAPRTNPQTHVIQREFYARPQKLQRQVWPPSSEQQQQQQQQQSPTRNNQERGKNNKPSNHNVRRVRTDMDSESEYSNHHRPNEDRNSFEDPQVLRERFYSSLYDDNTRLSEDNNFSRVSGKNTESGRNAAPAASAAAAAAAIAPSSRSCQVNNNNNNNNGSGGNNNNNNNNNNKGAFVTTLSRIRENVASPDRRSIAAAVALEDPEARNGTSSLPPSPASERKNRDKFPIAAHGLKMVSKRAKQFESGRLLSDEDEPTGDRTDLYKSELSRLSSKRSVPNVAVRKREFESKAESRDVARILPNRESKSLDSDIPDEDVGESRARSNSAESWEAINGGFDRQARSRHAWQEEMDERESKRSGKAKRQDSYLQAVGTRLAQGATGCSNGVVLRRQKNAQLGEEERATRRVSYLKATWGERMHVDSDLELSDSEPAVALPTLRSAHGRWRRPLFPSDITPLRRIFEDLTQAAHLHRHYHRNSIVGGGGTREPAATPKDVEPVEREGSLHVKFTVLDGKRSTDRSWKQVWAVQRGPILCFYKDRHSQSPSATSADGEAGQSVDVGSSLVDVAEDYTKRKHVLRVANPTAEVLLQTEDAASMALWLRALHGHAAPERASDANSSTSKQQAVPQTPGPTTSPSAAAAAAAGPQSNGAPRLSPLPSHKGIRKLTSFRNRSPTGQSPVSKTRKPSQSLVEPLASPKTKTWKGRVAKQLRRMHGQAGSPSSPTAQLPPEGSTFKVPLELCPVSSFSEFVPLIVEMCTSIVEARGLEVIGIYRVPGNTAAISQLTESVNKGFENINLQDPRWSDVNVISSLLKSFFRQLPDSLLTADLYPMFIDADKIEDPQRRMATIRKLLRDLPEHHFETLKHLMFHLKRVVEHSEINKMEAKNLAIVFGPTLVRASGSRDNMVTMVTDMSHQCRIVESLLNNVDWFFREEDLDDLSRLSVNLSLPADASEVETTSNANHNLLLNNIQKVEGMREMLSARDIVSSIISAANRKIQRRRKGQEEHESEDHEEERVRAKQEAAEAPATARASMALNERQCSVSQMVMMHENKATNSEAASSIGGNSTNRPKYATTGATSAVAAAAATPTTSQPGASEQARFQNSKAPATLRDNAASLDAISSFSSASNETRESGAGGGGGGGGGGGVGEVGGNDEVAIRSYAGLSATTQERIRRFEQETKAMLQRDQHRQRREAEKREEERRRIETEWQLAKREMENDDDDDDDDEDDILEVISSSFLTERLGNPSHDGSIDYSARKGELEPDEREGQTRCRSTVSAPLSVAVRQRPSARQRSLLATGEQPGGGIVGERIDNGLVKKFKTDEHPSRESACPAPTRYGSLDSLHEIHGSQSRHASPSPSQHARGIPGDVSDDGSDLLTSLTSTFDRKWKSLVNPANSPTTSADGARTGVPDNGTKRDENDGGSVDRCDARRPAQLYRDPSLHKSPADDARTTRTSNVTTEKKEGTRRGGGGGSVEGSATPDNDRRAGRKSSEATADSSRDKPTILDATEKDESPRGRGGDDDDDDGDDDHDDDDHDDALGRARLVAKSQNFELSDSPREQTAASETTETDAGARKEASDSSYTNKLEKFESLSRAGAAAAGSRSRFERSESLIKRTENSSSKLKRSESLNKHPERLASPSGSNGGKLKRSESLNKHADRSESPNAKLKRSESLTKTEKTECNISKRRQQSVRKDCATKLKRKNGMPERSIKRRHTVGGTKDFDKVHWLDNKLQTETAERLVRSDARPRKSHQLRTSSPDLSGNRVNVADASFLIRVSFRGPSNLVFNVTNARPQSLPDPNLASKVFKVPLESHV